MKVVVHGKSWDIDPNEKGGILKEMSAEFHEINLTQWVNKDFFEAYMNAESWLHLPSNELVGVYNIAHYLNAEKDMKIIGMEIAKRLSESTYDGIKQILEYFDFSA